MPDATTTFTYDTRGRLIGEVRVDAQNLTDYNLGYEYDAGGNRTKKLDFTGQQCTTYEYDLDNIAAYGTKSNRLMKSELFTGGTSCVNPLGAGQTTYYDYNVHGNVERITTTVRPTVGALAASGFGRASAKLIAGADSSSAKSSKTTSGDLIVSSKTVQPDAGVAACPTGTTEYSAIRFGYANNGRAVTFVHDEHWCVNDTCAGKVSRARFGSGRFRGRDVGRTFGDVVGL